MGFDASIRRQEAPLAQEDRFASRVFNLVVVALLGYCVFRILRPFFGPILWASLIAFVLFPWNQRLRSAFSGRATLAAIVMTLAVTLGMAIPATLGTVAFAQQAMQLGQGVSGFAQTHQIGGVGDILKLPMIDALMSWLDRNLSLDAGEVQGYVTRAVQAAVQFLVSHSRDLLLGALGFFADVVMMLFVLFFFFRSGDAIAARLKNLIPYDPSRKAQLDQRLQAVTRAVVFGTVVTALAQGALVGVGLWIAGVPSPLVFGVLAAIASFIPFLGTGLVWAPAVLYVYAGGSVGRAIFLAIWCAVVAGSADNVLRPLLVSGRARMGTLTVLFGVLGGLVAFGMIGLFLGPIVLSLVLALIEFAEEGRAGGAPAPPAAG
jgi:predicted PurR-regulated permease PerM